MGGKNVVLCQCIDVIVKGGVVLCQCIDVTVKTDRCGSVSIY